MSLRLGAQVQRVRVRQHGHSRFQAVPGGDTFARLFPSLVGRELAIGADGVDLVSEPEMIRAVGWLSANGYFLRGGLQS
jgi:hypothetical protein